MGMGAVNNCDANFKLSDEVAPTLFLLSALFCSTVHGEGMWGPGKGGTEGQTDRRRGRDGKG
eukprot:3798097-Rhodomonas_salina.1